MVDSQRRVKYKDNVTPEHALGVAKTINTMPKQHYYLCSPGPFDFGVHCSSCHRPTGRLIAVDVERRSLPFALAEMAFHPLLLLRPKSVRVPYCQLCSGSLWTLRIASSLLFLFLAGLLVYLISGVNPKFDKNSDTGMYLIVVCIFGVALIPYVYTTLKELFLGVNIYIQDDVYYFYVFRNPKVLHFLERQGLCYRSREEAAVWIAAVHSEGSGISAPPPLPKTA